MWQPPQQLNCLYRSRDEMGATELAHRVKQSQMLKLLDLPTELLQKIVEQVSTLTTTEPVAGTYRIEHAAHH